MFQRIKNIIVVILLAGVLGCTPDQGERVPLMVFAAASLNDVMSEVGERFEATHDIEVNFNFAGSNVLAQQLLAAPRADLFISANKQWMKRLGSAGRIVPGSRKAILGNSLVVIVNQASTFSGDHRALLCAAGFERLSIGNPDAVPAGIYAAQWLQQLDCDGSSAWDRVAGLVAPAPNVRAALGLVEADRAIPGIVYATDAAMSDKVRVLHLVSGLHAPGISYHAALVKNEPGHDSARQFMEYLAGEQAADIYRRHGFTLPAEP